MSRKRKTTRGNPARQDLIRAARTEAYNQFASYLREIGSQSLDEARQNVIDAGASEEQADMLMRLMRLRIAWEALEAGAPQVFEWVMEPVSDEIEILGIMEKLGARADEIGTPWEDV